METLYYESNNLIFLTEILKSLFFSFPAFILQRKQNMPAYLMITQGAHIPSDIYHLKTSIKDLTFRCKSNPIQFLKL